MAFNPSFGSGRAGAPGHQQTSNYPSSSNEFTFTTPPPNRQPPNHRNGYITPPNLQYQRSASDTSFLRAVAANQTPPRGYQQQQSYSNRGAHVGGSYWGRPPTTPSPTTRVPTSSSTNRLPGYPSSRSSSGSSINFSNGGLNSSATTSSLSSMTPPSTPTHAPFPPNYTSPSSNSSTTTTTFDAFCTRHALSRHSPESYNLWMRSRLISPRSSQNRLSAAYAQGQNANRASTDQFSVAYVDGQFIACDGVVEGVYVGGSVMSEPEYENEEGDEE
jgi:hypothetical protein